VHTFYEYPLNERVRTFLRLETLGARFEHFAHAQNTDDHHAALVCLFEILDVLGRSSEIKVELLQELERKRQVLLGLREAPDVAGEVLLGTLYEIEQASTALMAMTGRAGQCLRENEWLMSIKTKSAIAGGACPFDVPAYHYWLTRDHSVRQGDILGWFRPLNPLFVALTLVLRLLRASGDSKTCEARSGTFSMGMNHRLPQIIRLGVPPDMPAVPEISANRYVLNIRFLTPDRSARPVPVRRDFSFELVFCAL
jgi:cell division protein ZapD